MEPGVTVFPRDGRLVGDPPLIAVRGEEAELLVRSREPLQQLPVLAAGKGFGGPAAGPLSPIRERGRWLGIPLEAVAALEGRRGVREWLYRAKLRFQTEGEVTLRLSRPGGEE